MPVEDLPADRSEPISALKADLFKALAHPGRVRILEVLSLGEHSVSEIQPLVGIEASSHLSQQLGVLRRAGLVQTRRDGASVIYSLADDQIVELLSVAKHLLINSLTTNEDLLADLRSPQDPGTK